MPQLRQIPATHRIRYSSLLDNAGCAAQSQWMITDYFRSLRFWILTTIHWSYMHTSGTPHSWHPIPIMATYKDTRLCLQLPSEGQGQAPSYLSQKFWHQWPADAFFRRTAGIRMESPDPFYSLPLNLRLWRFLNCWAALKTGLWMQSKRSHIPSYSLMAQSLGYKPGLKE